MNEELADAFKRLEETKKETTASVEKVSVALAHDNLSHSIDGFTFDTKSVLLPKERRAVIRAIESAQSDQDLDKIQEACAVFMAHVSVCPKHDKDFWVNYDEETGYLMKLTMHVIGEMTITDVEIKTFRK